MKTKLNFEVKDKYENQKFERNTTPKTTELFEKSKPDFPVD